METTETMVIEGGYHQLSGEEIKEKIVGKTIRGAYLSYIFVIFFAEDGTMEGKNNVGAHDFGKWSVDVKDKSLTG